MQQGGVPPSSDGWKEDKTLGSGGFGTVVLWRNEETNETVAIKRCRVQNEMTAKHRQRWTLEVDIMKRLDHPNVISARDVPPPLDVKETELPLLAMEYCAGGDLRKVLNKPENCCGLKEYEIRCLVANIASAVEYLHGKRIIHRDLKPENIVLSVVDDKIVYKLIDLGYAKELDQGSVCTSFVGTLQYLAPELFASQKYTCTVDYWSFGTVVFECIAGYRPFLPTTPPVTWHKEVCQKSPEDISAYHDSNGEVKFSKKLQYPTSLCRTLQVYFEKWLQLMLRWDPKSRGGGLRDGRPHCFHLLDSMLYVQIIHILNVETNELLSYPLTEEYSMQQLMNIIEQETSIAVKDQDLLLASGASPDPQQSASQCWTNPCEDDWVVFLFRKGGTSEIPTKFKPLPTRVQHIVRDPTTLLPYPEQKKAWAECVFFCAENVTDYKRLILSQRAAMLSLLRTNSEFIRLKSKMVNECDYLMAKIKFFQQSLKHDMACYKDQMTNGVLCDSGELFQRWLQSGEDMDEYNAIKEECTMLDTQSTALQTKIVELQRSPFARTNRNTVLEEMEKQSRDLYQELRQSGRGGRETLRDHRPIVKSVVKCVMNRDKHLQDLYRHLLKIAVCKQELHQILPGIEKCCRDINSANEQLIKCQKRRQSEIWSLFRTMSGDRRGSNSSQASILVSLIGNESLESMQVVEDSKQTHRRLGQMLQDVLQTQNEHVISLDWDSLPLADT
ncbi:inhibitor of nuclear factor kappa-B kinase subunit alpha-like isoform X2 [Argopecten irradians]|uniref:inhibitor of nuclear factor kappa-B kinase subunit alpha-like isoform X2 n=1 Tax=Argopecten irradians TaxID=31199 RepID=UPI00371CF009